MKELEFAQKLMEIVDMKISYLDEIREANKKQEALGQIMDTTGGYNMMAYGQSKQLDENLQKFWKMIQNKQNEFYSTLEDECKL